MEQNDIKKGGVATGRFSGNEPNSIDLTKPELLRKQVSEDEYEKFLNESNDRYDPYYGTWLRKYEWKCFSECREYYNRKISRKEEKNGMET